MSESLNNRSLFSENICIIIVQVECVCANGLPSGQVKFEGVLGRFDDAHDFKPGS